VASIAVVTMLTRRRLVPLIISIVAIMRSDLAIAEEPLYRTDPDLMHRIERVLNGLRTAVVVDGDAPMKLSDRMKEFHVPGISIAVIHGGTLEWARGFGKTAVGGPSVVPETPFHAGSISKPVTAMAVLALAQAGKFDLDADVNLVLKDWKIPDNPYSVQSKVTLRRLLSHSAGTNVPGYEGYPAGAPVPSLVDILNGTPPANNAPVKVEHEPGKQTQYSGGGYTIVQQLLIDVTGRPFPALLDDAVLKPLGMTHSSFEQPLPPDQLRMAAMPHRPDGAAVAGGPHLYPEMAAAGLWTTPTDLAHLLLAVLDSLAGRSNAVLSQSTAAEMLSPVRGSAEGLPAGLGVYGLGWIVRGSAPNRQFWHNGANEGFAGTMVIFENGDGAVVMTNGGSQVLVGELLRSIAAEYGWPDRQAKVRKLGAVVPQTLDRLVGTYRFAGDYAVQVTREGDRLFSQATGQNREEIFPESDRDFFSKTVDAVLSFDLDDDGPATQVMLRQDGKNYGGKRVP
jgi:CubicO group peptidase (beta-lactamase class C family)